ncbi:MAG: AAA family ATPase [Anaerolineales bacterium]|nr:AAA family ATPase [Anaerolineales bacterium]
MKSILILIGPMCAGKSTLAKLLAKRLGVPRIELDEIRQRFYHEIGYDEKHASEIVGDQGMMGLINYWKPFEAHAVERALDEFETCVLDFGAGHSVYENNELFSRVEKALKPHKHVILILPSPDLDRSVEIVNQRFSELLVREVGKVDTELLALNELFVRHPSNRVLAKKIIYTEGKEPEESCQDILDWVRENGSDDYNSHYSQLNLF